MYYICHIETDMIFPKPNDNRGQRTTMAKTLRSLSFHFVASLSLCVFTAGFMNSSSDPPLTLDYYKLSCPAVLGIVRKEMECTVLSDPRNAALIVRLHFHDCFVQGCDGSVLLDDTVTLKGEKKAPTNIHSLGGFRIMDRIKNMLESECPGVVSCADILTIAARDAVLLVCKFLGVDYLKIGGNLDYLLVGIEGRICLSPKWPGNPSSWVGLDILMFVLTNAGKLQVGGPYWDVPLGRKDSRMASFDLASTNLPTADESLLTIIAKFLFQGLSVTDMVALAGSHTIGMARCENFRSRIYGDYGATSAKTLASGSHLSDLKSTCPALIGEEDDDNVAPMDYVTPNLFDNSFYHLLLQGEGLLDSDQEMFSGVAAIATKEIVKKYALDQVAFFAQFSESFVKLGNITNLESFVDGEVRRNCRFVNTEAQEESS